MLANEPIRWRSKKQDVVAKSTVVAEYLVLLSSVRKALWIKKLNCMDKNADKIFNISMEVGYQGCIVHCRGNIVNDGSKQTDIKFQLLVDNIKKETVLVQSISTSNIIADALTKTLPREKFHRFVELMGMK